MATRFYLPGTAAATPISPTPDAAWEDTSILARAMTSTATIADPMATVAFDDANATNRDVLFRQYISLPLTAGQTIAGVQGIADKLGDVLSGAGDVARAIATSVKNAINSIIDQINRLLEFSFTIPVPGLPDVRVSVNAPDIPHLARGARGFGGGLAMVGERGPELVSLPRGSNVYTASDTRRMMGGGGGITINNLNVVSPLGTPQQIADAVRTALVQLERTGRMRRVTV